MEFRPPPKPEEVWINAVLYGPPKTGKTAGACTLTNEGGVLLFNCDLPNRTRFARSKRRDPDGRIQEIAIPDYSTGEDNKKADQHILKLMGEISRTCQVESEREEDDRFKTIVVDPLGELYRRLHDEQSSRVLNSSNSLKERLATTTYIERFCRYLCELPMHTILVCHELAEKDEATESFEKLPFTGTSNTNLGQKLMGMVDIIGYTGIKQPDKEQGETEMEYVAQLVPGAGRRGGDGYGCLGAYRKLDLSEWLQRIRTFEAGEEEAVLKAA